MDLDQLRREATFQPAPEGATAEERMATALEFIAKEMGEVRLRLDQLTFQLGDDMNSLIANLPS